MSDSAIAPVAHAPAAGHAAGHGKKGLGNPVLGMLLFIVSEIMFFAGLFAAYFNLRTSARILRLNCTARRSSPRS